MEVVGNYDQSEVILPKHLVTNVINNKDAYLDDSSDFRQPIRGKVGDVQASSAYARAFVFDDLMVQCQFYMLKMTCEKQDSYLNQLIQEKSRMLPMGISNHRVFLNKNGELKSQLITSTPVVVSLNLENLKVTLSTTKVCPKFEKIISHKGCHSCAQLATIVIEAYSTCLPGEVQVHIETLPISTRVIKLTTTPQKFEIQIKSSTK